MKLAVDALDEMLKDVVVLKALSTRWSDDDDGVVLLGNESQAVERWDVVEADAAAACQQSRSRGEVVEPLEEFEGVLSSRGRRGDVVGSRARVVTSCNRLGLEF